jgi:hypothetical protein
MKGYFSDFPKTSYNIDGVNYNMTNLTSYVDIDLLKGDDIDFYSYVTIPDGYRPDNMSTVLYGTDTHYWTFFLINKHLKNLYTDWPKSLKAVYDTAAIKYPGVGINIHEDDLSKFSIDAVITGSTSNTYKVIGIHATSLWIQLEPLLEASAIGNDIVMTFEDNTTFTTIGTSKKSYNMPHHYVYNDDLDVPILYTSSDSSAIPISNLDVLVDENESKSEIRAIKPEIINKVVSQFKSEIKKRD